jgi:hypothetical protein
MSTWYADSKAPALHIAVEWLKYRILDFRVQIATIPAVLQNIFVVELRRFVKNEWIMASLGHDRFPTQPSQSTIFVSFYRTIDRNSWIIGRKKGRSLQLAKYLCGFNSTGPSDVKKQKDFRNILREKKLRLARTEINLLAPEFFF